MAPRQGEVDRLEKLQRRQLRHLLGHRWDQKVPNHELHQVTGTVPVEVVIVRARWTLLGHLARKTSSGDGSPANQVMQTYFWRRVTQSERPRSSPRQAADSSPKATAPGRGGHER